MSSTLPRIDGPADAELISAVRGGDVDAYGELYARHVDAATRLARQLVPPADADDLVSDAFAKVLTVLQRGGGPDVAFRAYLLTAIRRLNVDRIRAGARLQPVDDLEPFDPGVPFQDTTVATFENEAAARAFASLPERWQLVLWHLEVEGNKPADIAPLLGMSANSVSALAYRAREGLRQAFLSEHAQEIDDDACRWTHQHLGPYIRNGISRRDAAKVESHLDGCRKCMAVYLELSEVNSDLSGILAPLLLGAAATGYLASAGGVAAKGGVLFLLSRARDAVTANAPAAAVAGVAATAVIGGATFAAITLNSDHASQGSRVSAGNEAPGATVGPGTPRGGGGPGDRGGRGSDRGAEGAGPGTVLLATSGSPSESASESASESSSGSTEPSDDSSSTGGPSSSPTDTPTTPTDTPTTPTDTPTTPTDTPTVDPANDLRVSATAQPGGDGYAVTATVSGLSTRGLAWLTLQANGLDRLQSSDCLVLSRSRAECLVVRNGSLQFTAEPDDGSPAVLTFRIDPIFGTPDTDPTNNVTQLTLAATAQRPLGSLGPSPSTS